MDMKKDIKGMDKDTKNSFASPAIILMGIGAILSATLFYFMFKYADQGNLLMVLITSSLIVVVAFGVVKGISYVSKQKFAKE
jgi:ABC-type Fe3+-siderophore transport system permease subunit